MRVTPIKTRVLLPPADDLCGAIRAALSALPARSVLAITSKVVSIWQGRCVRREAFPDKDALVKKEADKYLPRSRTPLRQVIHTIKNNFLIASAGIDESNGNGYYILWPLNPKRAARILRRKISSFCHQKEFGVLITDSHSIPFRRGVVGISLGHDGFEPLKDYRGKKDLFGRSLAVTQTNIPDALSAAAVLAMGEGDEATPLALIEDIPGIRFVRNPARSHRPFSSFEVAAEEDLFAPFWRGVHWKEGGHGV